VTTSRAEQTVAVAIVTHDAAGDLGACLTALAAQSHRPAEVVVVDNASRDGSARLAEALGRELGLPLRVLAQTANLGFSAGMNLAVEATSSPWLLSLNADAVLDSGFLAALLARAERSARWRIGALTGRLRRFASSSAAAAAAAGEVRLDACGMFLHPSWRHFDRGADQLDRGQYQQAARVFGGTGAATLFRRAALLDTVLENGAVFDPDFFAFREDAELAFRLRERGWEVLYEPTATAAHRRANLPRRRRAMPPLVNYHTFKNRFLLRIYHQTAGNARRTLVTALARDLAALTWVLLAERSSLPALGWLWRERRRLLARRRWLFARHTVPPAAIDVWFRHHELPLEGPETT
jgi:GT2 family glycosyltransferase